jgi:16S rRNA (cytosine1402-N4)-methyltransferase
MVHIPVLLQSVIQGINPRKGMIFLDGTFGAGGHSLALAKRLHDNVTIVALDSDQYSLNQSVNNFKTHSKATLIPVCTNFRLFADVLRAHHIASVDATLLDLGFSSDQVDTFGRGISFMRDEPLTMNLKSELDTEDLTAREIVNVWDEANIRDIIFYYGEEKYASRIARGIVEARSQKEIHTTFELVDIIKNSVPLVYKKQKIHPATRTFQALRIAVNDELNVLRDFLSNIIPYIGSGGRVAIISFHSLEDRIVKRAFVEWEKDNIGKRITKKPIIADSVEIAENPRSRSAKLRIFEKN